MEDRKIWANAVLKDGKLMFWWTGNKCEDVYDFYKDFMYSGLKMMDEIATGKYALEQGMVSSVNDTSFYKQFELHEDFKGIKPY